MCRRLQIVSATHLGKPIPSVTANSRQWQRFVVNNTPEERGEITATDLPGLESETGAFQQLG